MFRVLFGSLIATALWYCFDDKLAELTATPSLGMLHWLHVWAATAFVAALLSAASPPPDEIHKIIKVRGKPAK